MSEVVYQIGWIKLSMFLIFSQSVYLMFYDVSTDFRKLHSSNSAHKIRWKN